MSQTIQTYLQSYEFNRQRTLGLLDNIAKEPDPQAVLALRPGPGRAHIGWQLVHIAVTEEIFATERLAPEMPKRWQELWPRFRGGSTPDDDVPSLGQIREVLDGSRSDLVAALRDIREEQLGEILPAFAQRGWAIRDVLAVIGWHEAHHQGQAHLTFNLYKAKQGSL